MEYNSSEGQGNFVAKAGAQGWCDHGRKEYEARIAEAVGAVAVMALERIPQIFDSREE